MVPDCSTQPRTTKEDCRPMRLSQENLRTLEASHPESDTHYADNVVRTEGQMMAYQEMSRKHGQSRKRDSGVAFSTQEEEEQQQQQQQQSNDAVDEVKIPKRPRTSVETPFRRYVTMGPREDPFPLYGKQAMEKMAVSYGSLESAGVRRDAAVLIEQSLNMTKGERRTV